MGFAAVRHVESQGRARADKIETDHDKNTKGRCAD